ncbi:phospholipid-binding protein, PBP family [Staphylothermus marinus F1]|uniref:Phospholipid-binding protein, PBP family n=1 Tax=Staphylothermus marinus (strain ATCC 43588 / DSM 3639 / JCM 9404 / F1) TaxID=399550 RepID=A3DPS3_STAMF|nr:YbhB/YbcL family Raf kinase inhibitor-like protein [Staphylothermus marinus]ABN70633.1 phospholipid-binding protein, PBP family [Staphylothermus marinus F1]
MSRRLIIILILIVVAILVSIVFYMFLFKPVHEVYPSPIRELIMGKQGSIRVWSPAFSNGSRIPSQYTCDGIDESFPLRIENISENTRSLLLIMYDPDAPHGVFYHWILYNIPPNTTQIPENIPKTPITKYGLQGRNNFGKIGYGGPCPPRGFGSHRYYIIVLALNTKLKLPPGANINEVIDEAKNHVIAYGVYMGRYSR